MIIGTLIDAGLKILDKVIPDPEQKAAAQLELMRLQQAGEFKELEAQTQINLAQAEINKVEAASDDRFKSGWRPFIGWVCGWGLAYHYLVRPLLPWLVIVIESRGTNVPPLPSLDASLFELVMGMLGLGVLRTVEKLPWLRK
jgi:hypothetical protein